MPQDKDKILIKHILARQNKLEDVREKQEDIWEEISYFGCSRRPDFKNKQEIGKKQGTKIFDGTPAAALNLYVDGILGYYVSRSLQWFNYRLGGYQFKALNENKDVRNWLSQVKEAVYWQLGESNFYDAIREFLLDGGSIGNANMFIDENIAKNSLDFLVRHPRELWFLVDSRGEVNGVHRKFELDARSAVEEFGKENLSSNIKLAYEKDRINQKFEFLHVIYPVEDFIPNEYDPQINKIKKFHNFVSYYIEVDKKILLRRGGYKTLNPVIWRMKKYSGEVYGRGLLGDAISEVKRLNSASKTQMQVAQLSAEPPLNVPFEMKDKVDMTPHGSNYYRDAGRMVVPVQTGANYPVTEDYIERLQAAVEKHFKVEFFLMLARADKTMTATEIIEKQGEKVALMSSQLGMLSKALNDIHNRTLNLMFVQGKLPPIPSVLLGETGGFFTIDVDYVGPLAEAQKRLFKARGIRQSLEVAAPYIEMFPGIKVLLNDIELGKELFLSHGMPAKVMREDEEVEQILKQQAQMQQQNFQMEMAEKEANVAQKLQKPIEKDSVIDKVTKGE